MCCKVLVNVSVGFDIHNSHGHRTNTNGLIYTVQHMYPYKKDCILSNVYMLIHTLYTKGINIGESSLTFLPYFLHSINCCILQIKKSWVVCLDNFIVFIWVGKDSSNV